MANLVHCSDEGIATKLDTCFPLNQSCSDAISQLSTPLDRSTQACVPKRLLAQKLVEMSGACKELVDALGSSDTNRDAVLVVLMHCCQLNVQLAIACNKHGLLQKLLKLVHAPGLPDVSKVQLPRKHWMCSSGGAYLSQPSAGA